MASDQYEFGEFHLELRSQTLHRAGQRVVLAPKVAELLVAFVESGGRVLTREELIRQLWPDTVVEDGSLTSHVSLLRKILTEGEEARKYIETLPKRGYRFVEPVERLPENSKESNVDKLMLVVLPFENLSVGERYDYFSDGLTEEMIAELARLSPGCLRVIARTSAMLYKSTQKSIAQIGRELAVTHVLEGSVRRVAERVRITAQLIRVSDESHVWAQSYERELHDVLQVQAEVARAVAREIEIKLTPQEQQRLEVNKSRSVNPEAHELYLRGRHFWYRRTEEAIRKSITCYEDALKKDRDFAAAYDGISDAHTMLACRGMTSSVDSFPKAKAAARRAVLLQPELGEGYATLAHVRLHDWDWVSLELDFQQAVKLDPGYAIAHYWYAEYLMAMGRAKEAIDRVEHARQLDPLNSVINASVGMIRYLAHDFDGALVALRRGLEIDSNHYVSHLRVGLACLQKKSMNEAIDAMQQAVNHSGSSTEALAALAQARGVAGDKLEMERIIEDITGDADRYISPYNLARVYGATNDTPLALKWLKKAYQEHNPDLIELMREPSFTTLHGDPQFREIVEQIGWSNIGSTI